MKTTTETKKLKLNYEKRPGQPNPHNETIKRNPIEIGLVLLKCIVVVVVFFPPFLEQNFVRNILNRQRQNQTRQFRVIVQFVNYLLLLSIECSHRALITESDGHRMHGIKL